MIDEKTIQQWEAEAKERTKWNVIGQHPKNEVRILALISALRESQARVKSLEYAIDFDDELNSLKAQLQAAKEIIAKKDEYLQLSKIAVEKEGSEDPLYFINTAIAFKLDASPTEEKP